jgi:homoaconitase/3-isopropylmalate dehydratase large subunit
VGGRYADLNAAAHILQNRKVTIPLNVTAATHAIYQRCLNDGTIQTLVDAGAIIHPAGCGACAGLHSGTVAAGEKIITTATRNFKGRMGSQDSEIYLASPYTVAASAVAGRIVDPREVAGMESAL